MRDTGASSDRPPDKSTVRRTLRAQRRTIAAERDLAADAHAIAARVLDLLPDPAASTTPTVLSYESTPLEPPTTAVNRALAERGWRVLVPITLPSFDLDWQVLGDPTPLGTHAPTTADAALVPGLAVDPFGTRLGQGGGCYDRVLPRLRPGVPVALLLHPGEMSASALPREDHDERVALVVTADATLRL